MFKSNVLFYMDVNKKLNEGIVFFKNSNRIETLARKIKVKISLINDNKAKEELSSFCSQLLEISPQFRNLESEYQEAQSKEERGQIKEKYKSLENKYHKLIKSIDRESFFRAVKITGTGILIIGVIGTLLFGLLGKQEYNYYKDQDYSKKLKNIVASMLEKEPTEMLQDTNSVLTKI